MIVGDVKYFACLIYV